MSSGNNNNVPEGWEQWDELPEDQFPKLSPINKNPGQSNSISKPKQRTINTYVEPPIPEIVLRDTQPKFRILQKPSGKNSPPTAHSNNSTADNSQSNGQNNSAAKTIEARQEEYERVRKRIFDEKQNGQNTSDEYRRQPQESKRNEHKGREF